MTSPWFAVALGLIGGLLTWAMFGVCFGLILGEGLRGFGYFVQGAIQAELFGIFVPASLGVLVGLTFWMIDRPDRAIAHEPAR